MEKKQLEPLEKEAIEILTQLQYRQSEAEEMVALAAKDNPKINKVEDLISIIFKNEIGRQ